MPSPAVTSGFGEAARELLAFYIEQNLPTQLAAVETALSLPALSLGRPSAVLRGADPSDPRDNKIEVCVLTSAPLSLKDRTLFQHKLEVSFTLFSTDAKVLPVQTRLARWETAWWKLMASGGTTMGGLANAALCELFSSDTARSPRGLQFAMGLASLHINRQES